MQRQQCDMVVINGCPRSGTSVLDTFLARKFNGVLMPESHFIPLFSPYLFLWGNLNNQASRKALINAIYDFTEIRTNGTGLDVKKMQPYCLLATRDKINLIVEKTQSYPDIICELYQMFKTIHNGSFAIEKTAYYAPVSWDLLSCLMPNAKMIHIIRDGRDVVMSWEKTWFGPKSLALASWLWAKHVKEGMRWGRKNPDRYLELHYEKMTSAPEATLGQISAFLGQQYDESEYDQSSLQWLKFLSKKEHMTNIGGAFAKNNFEKWRSGLSLDELALVEAIAGKELEEAGYQLAAHPPKAFSKFQAHTKLTIARLTSLLSKVAWKRRMVKLLPIAIWFTNKLGISLPSALRKIKLVQGR